MRLEKAELHTRATKIDPWEQKLYVNEYFLNPVYTVAITIIINITFLENIPLYKPWHKYFKKTLPYPLK